MTVQRKPTLRDLRRVASRKGIDIDPVLSDTEAIFVFTKIAGHTYQRRCSWSIAWEELGLPRPRYGNGLWQINTPEAWDRLLRLGLAAIDRAISRYGADAPAEYISDPPQKPQQEREARPKGTDEVRPQGDDPSPDSPYHGGDGCSGEVSDCPQIFGQPKTPSAESGPSALSQERAPGALRGGSAEGNADSGDTPSRDPTAQTATEADRERADPHAASEQVVEGGDGTAMVGSGVAPGQGERSTRDATVPRRESAEDSSGRVDPAVLTKIRARTVSDEELAALFQAFLHHRVPRSGVRDPWRGVDVAEGARLLRDAMERMGPRLGRGLEAARSCGVDLEDVTQLVEAIVGDGLDQYLQWEPYAAALRRAGALGACGRALAPGGNQLEGLLPTLFAQAESAGARRAVHRWIAALERLLAAEVSPEGDRASPRYDYAAVVREIASCRYALARARREEVIHRPVVLAVDASGSCSSFCNDFAVAAIAVWKEYRDRFAVLIHSNSWPEVWLPPTSGLSEMPRLVAAGEPMSVWLALRQAGLVVACGDYDGWEVRDAAAGKGLRLWEFNNYGCSYGPRVVRVQGNEELRLHGVRGDTFPEAMDLALRGGER